MKRSKQKERKNEETITASGLLIGKQSMIEDLALGSVRVES